MGPILAIGGGEIADAETESIDRRAIDAATVTTPHVLFVPTASGDAEEYVEKFESYYGSELSCETSTLRLTDPDTSVADARSAIESADIIYVGGGDTGFLVDTVRSLGLRDSFLDHRRTGGVLTGLSAGALCWFEYTLSDAIALDDVAYGPTAGFGLVTGLHATVHADFRRRQAFRRYLARRNAVGVALGDCAALEIVDDQYRVHSSSPDGFVYHVDPRAEEPVTVLSEDDAFSPLAELRAAE
jgi:dipeptidase E